MAAFRAAAGSPRHCITVCQHSSCSRVIWSLHFLLSMAAHSAGRASEQAKKGFLRFPKLRIESTARSQHLRYGRRDSSHECLLPKRPEGIPTIAVEISSPTRPNARSLFVGVFGVRDF